MGTSVNFIGYYDYYSNSHGHAGHCLLFFLNRLLVVGKLKPGIFLFPVHLENVWNFFPSIRTIVHSDQSQ